MNTFKRSLCLLLTLALMLGLMPNVFAAQQTFIDVPAGMYYSAPVAWAVENGITNGTGANTFSPDTICSRGQVVTFLWRAQGKPAPASNLNPFTDVPAGSYYYDAVLWAVENGITTGTGNGTFSPGMSCSRGQIVTFLQRAIEPADPVDPPAPPVDEHLRIVTQPQSATIEESESAILRVVVTGGTAPYTYQWKKNGNNIVGANSDGYTASKAGSYTCTISDAKGSSIITSEAIVTIRAQDPLVILQQPQTSTIASGNKVTLTVSVSGGKLPYHYRWSINGIAIDGVNSASYTTGEAGNYICTVTDDANNSVTTNTAVVSVYGGSDKPYEINYQLTYYNVNKGDQYIATQYIDNSDNPKFFGPADSFELKDVVCPGYEFLGWFTAGGTHVTEISAGTTRNLTLYARWAENNYTITYNLYQTPVTSTSTAEQKSYTVSKGNYNLYNPEINNYIFLGWYDKNGVEYKTIPIGTTGNIVLNAYYTSRRNLAVSKVDNNPIIVEDRNNNVVYFTYEISEPPSYFIVRLCA